MPNPPQKTGNILEQLKQQRQQQQTERSFNLIDLQEQPKQNIILRGGNPVPTPPVDDKKVDDFVNNLQPIRRIALPRVVQQSIAPGVRVAKGTAVDIVLVAPIDINIGLLAGAHADLQNKSINDVLPILQDPAVSTILNKYASADDITPEDKTALSGVLTSKYKLGLDDTNASKSFASAFGSLKGAQAFE